MVKSQLSDIIIPEWTINQLIFGVHGNKHGDKVALVDAITKQTYTYRQLEDLYKRAASGLVKLGVKKGDVVAIHSRNNADYAVIVFAVLQAGAIVTTTNPSHTKYEIENQLRDCGAKYIYTTNELLTTILELAPKLGTVKKIISLGGGEKCVPFSCLLNDDGSAFPHDIEYDLAEDVALILYSSGTTGLPKGVMLTHRNIVANFMQKRHPAVLVPPPVQQPVSLSYLPFFHTFGLIVSLFERLERGGKQVLLRRFQPELFLHSIQTYKVTVVVLVPSTVYFLLKTNLLAKFDVSSLTWIGVGGAPLSAEAETRLQELLPHAFIRQGYGMTETSPAVFMHISGKPVKVGSLGRPAPNTEVKVVDVTNGQELGQGQEGELCIRGPQIMKGYLNKPEATRATIDSDGFLHTGDIGYYDKDEVFFITDRIKDLIKVKGFQVAPAELEALLTTHPAVDEVAVVGIPNIESGQVPCAFVVRKPGSKVTARELQNYVEKRLARYKWLQGGVHFTDLIPKTSTGKILRRSLRRKYSESKL